jgi:hypothetical protein
MAFSRGRHLLQKRFNRGALLAISIWAMFVIGLWSGGAYYPGFDFQGWSVALSPERFCNVRNGLGDLISFLVSVEPAKDVAARSHILNTAADFWRSQVC